MDTARFLKYAGLSILAQLLICITIWVLTILMFPALNPLFDKMVRFYEPAIFLVSRLGGAGESAMIAAGFFGILFGIIGYGIIFGLAFSLLKRSK